MAEDLEQLLAEGSEMAVIGYHLTDIYANTYSNARAEYYGMFGLPHVVIDGSQTFDVTYEAILERYEIRIAIPSSYTISFEVDRNGKTVNATVNVGQISAPNPETKVLHLVLTESHIPDSWYGGDEVNHTERLMIPDQNGIPIVSGKSVLSTFEFEFEMDTSWSLQNCELVAFLQDTITKEIMQSQVFLLESTVLFNDVALKDIVNPSGDYCNESISPIIKIENYGADTLLNCLISYTVNDDEYEYEWEGTLSTYQSEDVTLPEISFNLLENNSIIVELSQPNGQDDENQDNNLIENSFSSSQIINSQNLILELKTDYFGSETSWELQNSLGEIVCSGNGYEDTTQYFIDLDLGIEDCYTFSIYDTGGDGICCGNGFGYYRIKDTDGLIYYVGGTFEDQDISTFQIDIASDIFSLAYDDDISIFPNPVSDFINIESLSVISKIYIMDTKGFLLFESKVLNIKRYNLDLSKYPSGIYFIKVESENSLVIKKVMKI